MQVLFGAAALSEFKTARLLSSLRAIAPEVQALESTFVHFVDAPELAPAQIDTLTALLTYGERAESSREPQQSRCLGQFPRGPARPPTFCITAAFKQCAESSAASCTVLL